MYICNFLSSTFNVLYTCKIIKLAALLYATYILFKCFCVGSYKLINTLSDPFLQQASTEQYYKASWSGKQRFLSGRVWTFKQSRSKKNILLKWKITNIWQVNKGYNWKFCFKVWKWIRVTLKQTPNSFKKTYSINITVCLSRCIHFVMRKP